MEINSISSPEIVGAIGGIAAVIIAGVFGIITQYKLKKMEKEKLQEDARVNYEYNARKRLYEQCEPILFQLYERSQIAYERISHMPKRAATGKLSYNIDRRFGTSPQEEREQSGSGGWLSGPGYYMISTIYNVLAPLALIKILQNAQNRLTSVDLAVDPSINAIYQIAKNLFRTFSADKDLADTVPIIEYNLYEQGIFAGYLDMMIEELIEYYYEPDKAPRLKSFGKFYQDYIIETETETRIKYPFDLAYYILLNFHPKTKPVLWRILVTQLYLYNAIINIYEWKTKERIALSELPKEFRPIKDIPELKIPKDLDWRQYQSEATDEQVLVEPYEAVKKYLSKSKLAYLIHPSIFY